MTRGQDVVIWNETGDDTAGVTDSRLDVNAEVTGGLSKPPKYAIAEFTGNQAGGLVLTPTAGYKIRVLTASIENNGNTGNTAELEFGTSAILIWKQFGTNITAMRHVWFPMNIVGDTDETIVINTSGLQANVQTVVALAYEEIL